MDLLGELEKRVVCGDGAIGTLLINDGVPLGRCFEDLCLSEPDRIRNIHETYIAAGAQVIETNTFGANAHRLARFGFGKRVGEINRAAVELARDAAKSRKIYVAGSVGPSGITAEEAAGAGIDRASYLREQISTLVDAGVDLILLETFTDFAEMEAVLLMIKQINETAVVCSFACPPNGQLRCGTPVKEAFRQLRDQGADLVGVNCLNNPQQMVTLLQSLAADYPLAVYPTAGQPRQVQGKLAYHITAEMFAAPARELIMNGARLLGGCCGTTPSHIGAVAAEIRSLQRP